MIIIWRGHGILAPFVFGLITFLAHSACQSALGVVYMHAHVWPMAVSIMVGGLGLAAFAKWLDQDEEGHSFYFIPVKAWAVIAMCVGIGFFFTKPASETSQTASAREKGRTSFAAPVRTSPR